MNPFNLPSSTVVDKVVPKNAFDSYASSKQKRLLSQMVSKIVWKNKLSTETLNLPYEEVREIQIFNLEMKQKEYPAELIQLIDKSIPYPIIFIVTHQEECVLSTSVKHHNPINPDNAIVDWHYKTDWFSLLEFNYSLDLRKNLDFIFLAFCKSLNASEKLLPSRDLNEMVDNSKALAKFDKEILQLERAISKEMQFNRKVEMNLELNNLLKKRDGLLNGSKEY